MLLTSRPWTSQPPPGTLINNRHPGARNATFAVLGSSINFNSAKGVFVPGTASGTVSTKYSSAGVGVYTPNGSWLNLTTNQDWSGANTLTMVCVIRGMDANYGGLFSKDSTGTSTQLGIGRDATSNNLYGSVSDATAIAFPGSSITAMTGVVTVLTFTHSGAASTPMTMYRDGAQVGVTPNLGTQPTGTGVLGLGRSRDSDTSFDSDVEWYAFIRQNYVMSAVEIANRDKNIWQIFSPLPKKMFSGFAAGGDVTLALTGSSATFSSGTVTVTDTCALAGSSATFSSGSVAATDSVALTGSSATFSSGNISAVGIGLALAGSSATFSSGTVTPSVQGDVTLALTGSQASFSSGNVIASAPIVDSVNSGGWEDWELHNKKQRKKREELLAKELAEQAEISVVEARKAVKKAAKEYPDFPLQIKKPDVVYQDKLVLYSEWIKPILEQQQQEEQERQRIMQQRNYQAIEMMLALI